MMEPSGEMNSSELESFREQWRAEVKAKKPAGTTRQPQPAQPGPSSSTSASARPHHRSSAPPRHLAPSHSKSVVKDYDDEDFQAQTFELPSEHATGAHAPDAAVEEPVTALEHYEKAVERETQGSLGDSLQLYRKAFRMDPAVDKKYKSKHFPAPLKPPAQAQPSRGGGQSAITQPAVSATSSSAVKPLDAQPQTLKDLIASFQGLSIEPVPPEVEGMQPPPCPIADLPQEILVHIMHDVAVADVADFVRLAQVCKRLAYLVTTEDQIWRSVCLDSDFGFPGMHRTWQKQVSWDALLPEDEEADSGGEDDESTIFLTPEARAAAQRAAARATTAALLHGPRYRSSWQRMFRQRPRVRFNGCYISTVNYIRSGQASASQVTWNSPVHIVTYFRYLRLFRDGTAISLLTTSEPQDVVHHLTRDALALHAAGSGSGGGAHLPSVVMQHALRGRWRLGSVDVGADAPATEKEQDAEADLVVETEGVGKYLFRLDLALRSAGRTGGTRNNKLVWRSHYSYNRLTDDWAEFELKNDKPFFFSRVKSYGRGD